MSCNHCLTKLPERLSENTRSDTLSLYQYKCCSNHLPPMLVSQGACTKSTWNQHWMGRSEEIHKQITFMTRNRTVRLLHGNLQKVKCEECKIISLFPDNVKTNNFKFIQYQTIQTWEVLLSPPPDQGCSLFHNTFLVLGNLIRRKKVPTEPMPKLSQLLSKPGRRRWQVVNWLQW